MTEPANWSLTVVESATSTSDLAREAADAGLPSGSAFLAIQQSAGRGRHGRHWASQRGGMYLSVLVRPEIAKNLWFGFSFAAALAVHDAVAEYFERYLTPHDMPQMGVKWPNDVIVDGGKIAGILLEARASCLIIGSGVNIAPLRDIPEGRFAPVAMASFLPLANQRPSPQLLADVYLDRLAYWIGQLIDGGFSFIHTAWRQRALFLGKRVEVELQGQVLRGVFTDLDLDGSMLLLDDSGKTHHITTGDVQLLGD